MYFRGKEGFARFRSVVFYTVLYDVSISCFCSTCYHLLILLTPPLAQTLTGAPLEMLAVIVNSSLHCAFPEGVTSMNLKQAGGCCCCCCCCIDRSSRPLCKLQGRQEKRPQRSGPGRGEFPCNVARGWKSHTGIRTRPHTLSGERRRSTVTTSPSPLSPSSPEEKQNARPCSFVFLFFSSLSHISLRF